MSRRKRSGGQYLSNVGITSGYTSPHVTSYLKGADSALANPVPIARTQVVHGGRKRRRSKRGGTFLEKLFGSNTPETPVPGNPVPGNPMPGNPVPGNPMPGYPIPVKPVPGYQSYGPVKPMPGYQSYGPVKPMPGYQSYGPVKPMPVYRSNRSDPWSAHDGPAWDPRQVRQVGPTGGKRSRRRR
jgi:hypothetical protein